MTGHKRNIGNYRLAAVAIVVLVLGGGGRAFAQAQEDWRLFSKDFAKSLGRDFAAVVTSPLHWDNQDLGRFAIATAVTLTFVVADEQIKEQVQSRVTETSQSWATFFEHFGNGAYLLGFTAVLYGAGEIWHSPGVRKTALLSLESLATTSVIVWVTKFTLGRARPSTGHDPYTFRFFTADNDFNSFPSGHTAAAFAVATTIAEQTRSVAVDLLVYSVATLVGLSRIHSNQHWASSVFAGGVLGYFVAHKISRRHRTPEPAKNVDLGFALGSDGLALTLTYVF